MQRLRRITGVLVLGVGALSAMVGTDVASAAQVHVRPVILDLAAPAATGNLTLRNTGREQVTAQVRVFRWFQMDGRDRLAPTREVVASPPLLRLRPGRENVVRVVRTVKRAVRGEEAYRLIVDEIPSRKAKSGGVKFAVRYSIPVFFHQRDATPPSLGWAASRRRGVISLIARNSGQRHERISDLRVVTSGGRTLARFPGLSGYVLGGATRVWRIPAKGAGGMLVVKGKGLHGPFTHKVRVR